MFLCAVLDGHSRKVLGHSVSDHIGAGMVTDAVDTAVTARGNRCDGTILHSDRGGEYTAHRTAHTCSRHGLRRSMGATGIRWDNSPAESFWSTFKHEHYYRHTYATKTELVAAVDKWIHRYNTERRHSALGMLSPIHYEHSLTGTAKAA
jgi:transposase InsO family protein